MPTPKEVVADILDEGICLTRDDASELIELLSDRGYVIVPKEATQKMICAALDEHDRGNRSYSDVYRAMTGVHQ